jgi:hypothetical protein
MAVVAFYFGLRKGTPNDLVRALLAIILVMSLPAVLSLSDARSTCLGLGSGLAVLPLLAAPEETGQRHGWPREDGRPYDCW